MPPLIAIDGAATKTINDPAPAITGSTDQPAGSTVTVTVAGQTLTATVRTGGSWTITPTTLEDGTHLVSASVTDTAGNTATAEETLLIDTVAPVIAIDGPATLSTKDSSPTITGSTDAPAGSTVTVTVAGQSLTATVGTGGTWRVTPTAALDDGSYTVTATTTDAAGNTATATESLTVDTVPPLVAIDGAATKTINDPTPAITGSTDEPAGSPVTVTVAGQTLIATVQTGGSWTVTPTTTLDEGTHVVSASVTDAAGNTATAAETLLIDTVAPLIAIDGAATKTINDPTPAITGSTDQPAGSTVAVTVAGQTLTATVQTGGAWTVTPTALDDGTHAVSASVTDTAGNTATAEETLLVDTVAPVIDIDGAATKTINDPTPVITGSTDQPAGRTVTVTVAGQTLTATVQTGGAWTVTPATLDNGTHILTATTTDAAGNTATATESLTVDTVSPLIAIDGGSSVLTNDPVRPISGSTDAAIGSTVTVTVAGQTLTATVRTGGTWTVTPSALDDGTHPISATVLDAQGGTATATQSRTVDTVAPVIAIDGPSAVDTADNTPTISGTTDAPAGSTVTVTVAGQTLTATVRTGGTWMVTPTTLDDGTHVVTASVTDAAGNTATATESLTVDVNPLRLTVAGGSSVTTQSSHPVIHGTTTAPIGSKVTVRVDGVTYSTTVRAAGTWSITTTSALDPGTYSVQVTITDPDGRVTTGTQALTVSRAAVETPVVTKPSPPASAPTASTRTPRPALASTQSTRSALASTGSDNQRLTSLAGLLMLAGFALTLTARKRRPHGKRRV